MEHSKNFERDYNFYINNIENFNFCGTLEPKHSATPSEKGISAKEAFYFIQSQGKNKPCSEPELLNALLLAQAGINFQIKQWAEARAEGTLPLWELSKTFAGNRSVFAELKTLSWVNGEPVYFDDIQMQYGLPDWVVKAVENQKFKHYKQLKMINITIDAATGDEARKALLELLGLTGETVVSGARPIIDSQVIIIDDPKPEATTEQVKEFVAETTKKRRTKAEIEAEKNASATGAEQPGDEPAAAGENQGQAETPAEEATSSVTKEDLQKKAVELGRVGKKELCRAVLQKYGADSISTADKNPLKVELYATVLDEFNKL